MVYTILISNYLIFKNLLDLEVSSIRAELTGLDNTSFQIILTVDLDNTYMQVLLLSLLFL